MPIVSIYWRSGLTTMKKIALLFSIAASLLAADIPRPAPDITIPAVGGKVLKSSDYRGKVLVALFVLTT